MKRIITFYLLFLSFISLQAQDKATIRGTVFDGETGETMIGANVYIAGTTTGKMTDLDGKYSLEGLEPGTYSIKSSFIGFDEVSQEVTVEAGEVFVLDFTLGEAAIEIEEVKVEAKASTNNEQALLTRQKKSAVVLDGISASQISKSGDSDAAGALRRVTGISVEGGKYVYVRGLGDRYSKTLVNGAQVPGLDPNRNTVQMDLFPTNLVDNIVVYKSFAPDLPGDFTGGLVDISTRDFPERFTLQFGASIGGNTNATLNKRYKNYDGGATDFLGIDNGTRDVPNIQKPIPTDNQAVNDPLLAEQLYNTTREFNDGWEYKNTRPALDHSLSFSIGNQKKLFKKPIGYVFGVTYKREWDYYRNGTTNRWTLPGPTADFLISQLRLSDEQSSDQVLWGGLFNVSYKVSNNSKISLNLMHNQTSQKWTRYQQGFKPADDPDLRYEANSWWFEQRSLSTAQLKGEHVIPGMGNTEFTWFSSFALSLMEQPDLRFFTAGYRVFSDTVWRIEPSIGQEPSRYWRDMEEYNWDNALKFMTPFKMKNGGKGNVKYGGGFLYKDRDFSEEQYRLKNNTGQYGGVPSIYFADTNLLGYDRPIDPVNRNGVFVDEFPEPGNTYNASQSVANAYVSAELPLKENLKLIAGARYEYTNISLLNKANDTASLINNDILPAITLNWGVNEKMNLRWAYSRTLARPTFRELAPYASFDFIGDFILVGNNDLERTLIDNADFRFEFYPNYGELIAVGLFYKHFNNPIERTFNIQAVNPELTYRNVDAAHLAGIEFEMRKNLGFISPKLENFSFGFNASYIYSRVDIDSLELVAIRALNPDANSTRQMFGQSPFLINLLISYQNQKGTSANLAFNIQGRQISVIGFKGNPNVFQMPIPNLNFTFDQELKKGWSIRFKAQNLLNAVDVEKQFLTAEEDGSPGEILKTEYVFQCAQYGVDLSVGVRYIIK